jgi:NAD(P)-dependent dehydrogenase (short-subunit alcohol dehydrogenase family)
MSSSLRCLVTGGSRNLGRAICVALARAGARVAFTYSTNDADAEAARAAIAEGAKRRPPYNDPAAPGDTLVYKGSVADAAHADATVRAIVAAWGGLDVLVNNAAITQILPVALVEEDDWDRVMSVNVKGAYLFTRAALRPMIKARAGRILNIGAFGEGRVVHAPVHYAASKAALAGFTDALARDVGRYGILVNLLSPGLLDVGLGRVAPEARLAEYLEQNPAGRFGTVEEIAEMAVWLVGPRNTFMTGVHLPVDGGA